MVDMKKLADVLYQRTEWQKTPGEMTLDDYHALILSALRKLYIETGRAALYTENKLIYEDELPVRYDADLMIDEEEYLLATAEVDFFRKVQSDVNNVFGYSTDALTITNADKPYVNLSATIGELEHKRRILYYKMVRFNLL